MNPRFHELRGNKVRTICQISVYSSLSTSEWGIWPLNRPPPRTCPLYVSLWSVLISISVLIKDFTVGVYIYIADIMISIHVIAWLLCGHYDTQTTLISVLGDSAMWTRCVRYNEIITSHSKTYSTLTSRDRCYRGTLSRTLAWLFCFINLYHDSGM